MHQQLENTLYHLTGKTDLSEVSLYDLELLSNKYPYFAPIHFFKAAKLKQGDGNIYWKQSQQTALFFSNPFWLQYQLNNNLNGHKKEDDIFSAFKIPSYKTSILQPKKPETETADSTVLTESIAEEAELTLAEAVIPIADTTPVAELSYPAPNQAASAVSNFAISSNDAAVRPIEIPTIENIKNMMGDWRSGLNNPSTNEPASTNDMPSLYSAGTSAPMHAVSLAEQATSNVKEHMQEILPETEDSLPVLENSPNDLEEKTKSKLSSILSSQAADFKKPVSANAQFDFESNSPSIDYFASQGINIDLTKIPQDKLTVQLRRFTDWLKQMRNVSPNPEDLGTDPELENAVQIIAKTSNESKEVVTEAMAEVLCKQGQKDKAAQLYIKLSFLNPDKSAYFAAKIQELKGI